MIEFKLGKKRHRYDHSKGNLYVLEKAWYRVFVPSQETLQAFYEAISKEKAATSPARDYLPDPSELESLKVRLEILESALKERELQLKSLRNVLDFALKEFTGLTEDLL